MDQSSQCLILHVVLFFCCVYFRHKWIWCSIYFPLLFFLSVPTDLEQMGPFAIGVLCLRFVLLKRSSPVPPLSSFLLERVLALGFAVCWEKKNWNRNSIVYVGCCRVVFMNAVPHSGLCSHVGVETGRMNIKCPIQPYSYSTYTGPVHIWANWKSSRKFNTLECQPTCVLNFSLSFRDIYYQFEAPPFEHKRINKFTHAAACKYEKVLDILKNTLQITHWEVQIWQTSTKRTLTLIGATLSTLSQYNEIVTLLVVFMIIYRRENWSNILLS